MALTPCAYRARAWRGDQLVADSTAALRDEEPDRAPMLWFPRRRRARRPARRPRLTRLTAGAGELDGHVAFDAERVRLDLVNSTDRRPTTVRSCGSRTGVTPPI